jgi:hypothetical protein
VRACVSVRLPRNRAVHLAPLLSQVASEKRVYDSWPDYRKHTLLHPEAISKLRVGCRVCRLLCLELAAWTFSGVLFGG